MVNIAKKSGVHKRASRPAKEIEKGTERRDEDAKDVGRLGYTGGDGGEEDELVTRRRAGNPIAQWRWRHDKQLACADVDSGKTVRAILRLASRQPSIPRQPNVQHVWARAPSQLGQSEARQEAGDEAVALV